LELAEAPVFLPPKRQPASLSNIAQQHSDNDDNEDDDDDGDGEDEEIDRVVKTPSPP
jgi:hypothetical protein